MEVDPKHPNKWMEFNPEVRQGKIYYASVFVDIKGKPNSQQQKSLEAHYYSLSKRLHYKLIKFETSEFFWPLELISALLGLVGIVVVSLLLIKKSVLGWVNSIVGFSEIRNDVDDVLEKNFKDLQKQDMEYFSDDYKTDVGEEGYATEDTDGGVDLDSSTLSVEDVIEA
jgi:hypothetical protein